MPIQELIMNRRVVRVGSRTSELALKQTNLIINLLSKSHNDITFKIITMETNGDKILDKELSKIGDKSLFTKELEMALLTKEVDFVVHSLKDVPTALSEEFALGCVCLRESVEDAVVMKMDSKYQQLEELPPQSVVGTSSVRRIAQLRRKYSHLTFASVRGNLNTRLRKLDSERAVEDITGSGDVHSYAALILAKAGLERIGLKRRISQVLSTDDSLYAVGQGALACECRADDTTTLKLLSSIHDDQSGLTTIAERSLMRQLDGGCSTPIAVRTTLSEGGGLLTLRAAVMSVDGTRCVIDQSSALLPREDVDTFLAELRHAQHEGSGSNGDQADGDAHSDSDEDDQEVEQQQPQQPQQPQQSHEVEEDREVELPLCKRVKRADCCDITDKEVQLGRDDAALFLGLRVTPICEIGRVRMAISQRLGAVVAQKLLAAGAGDILAGIQKTRGEIETNARHEGDKLIVN